MAAHPAGRKRSNHGQQTWGEPGCSGLSHRLLQSLEDFPGVVLVSHVHPDPDSLGCMMGLAYLIKKKLKKPSILTRDGFIGRAENQAMVRCLDIELTPIEDV